MTFKCAQCHMSIGSATSATCAKHGPMESQAAQTASITITQTPWTPNP